MMAMMYAGSIVNERINKKTGKAWAFDDVPARLKAEVADLLINLHNLPELVPVEFGGTAE